MAAPVYSRVYFSSPVTNAEVHIPADPVNTWVLRDLEALVNPQGLQVLYCTVEPNDVGVIAHTFGSGGGVGVYQWTGRLVLGPGFSFKVSAGGGTIDVHISGYYLTPS